MTNLKKDYFKLPKEEFNQKLNELINNKMTYKFFDNAYFYTPTKEINELILSLYIKQLSFDSFINKYDSYKQNLLIKTFIIEEIKTTNKIENIHSTRHDIFSLMNNVESVEDKHIKSIIQAYSLIDFIINDIYSIRSLYDLMMKDSYKTNNDKPDGEIFRKENIEISDGLNSFHKGFYPETKIIESMKEFVSLYTDTNIDIYERLILSHFLLETIHPFYDGNGRLGRLLMSKSLYKEKETILAYAISLSISQNKQKYYNALQKGRDRYSYGFINDYFIDMCQILIDGFDNVYEGLQEKDNIYNNNLNKFKFSNSYQKIYEILLWCSCFTHFGINNKQIIEYTKLSKRTIISCLNTFKSNNLLIDTKFGRETYHKINLDNINLTYNNSYTSA